MSEREELLARARRALYRGEGSEAVAALGSGNNAGVRVETKSPAPPVSKGRCLLLDCSGSMAEDCEPGRSKHAALSQLLLQFPFARKFAFANDCSEVRQIPDPRGGTDMARAFLHIKAAGLGHAVLITDGLPNREHEALNAAEGLRLDIFYVGPHPRPDFLDRLAKSTGGTAENASLRQAEQAKIAGKMRATLALPAGRDGL